MNFEGKTLIVITGASRGLGQAIAVQLAQKIGPQATLVLISRTLEDLKTTEKLCKEYPVQDVILAQVDLKEATKEVLENEVLKKIHEENFGSLVLVHNAGSLGNQGTKVTEFDNVQDMQEYYYLNVFSVMLLNSLLAKKCQNYKKKMVINISSLAALQPFETWGSYCSGKAARDSLFKVMAVEEPTWRVLNYAPGPLDTKMIAELLDDVSTNTNIRNAFEDMKSKKSLLTAEQSAQKLIIILDKNDFKSGDHIDYFDV